jgi:hypothetical protein
VRADEKVHTDLVGDMMEIWDKYDTNKDNKLYVSDIDNGDELNQK